MTYSVKYQPHTALYGGKISPHRPVTLGSAAATVPLEDTQQCILTQWRLWGVLHYNRQTAKATSVNLVEFIPNLFDHGIYCLKWHLQHSISLMIVSNFEAQLSYESMKWNSFKVLFTRHVDNSLIRTGTTSWLWIRLRTASNNIWILLVYSFMSRLERCRESWQAMTVP